MAEAKEGEKLHGVDSQAYQVEREGQEPHAQREAPAGSLLQPANTRPPRPHGPSASVVDVEVESLVAEQ